MAPTKTNNLALDEFRAKFRELGGPDKVVVGQDDILFDLVALVQTIEAMKQQWQIEALQRAVRIADLHENFDTQTEPKRISKAIQGVIDKISRNEDIENAT